MLILAQISHFCLRRLNQRGAAALITVLVISASALIMAYSASILGLGELEMGYDSGRGGETLALADGCREEALLQLKRDPNYLGGTLSMTRGSCIIKVEDLGQTHAITIDATTGYYTKHLETQVVVASGTVTALTWKQI